MAALTGKLCSQVTNVSFVLNTLQQCLVRVLLRLIAQLIALCLIKLPCFYSKYLQLILASAMIILSMYKVMRRSVRKAKHWREHAAVTINPWIYLTNY